MNIIEVSIYDEGEHWHKTVKLFGVTVYHRHCYSKDNKPRPIGFTVYPDAIVEVEDEAYWPEELKRKNKKT